MKKQSAMLFVLGVACVCLAAQLQSFRWVAIWFGLDFLILSAAYLARAHCIFGKRPDGTLPLWSWVLFLPYLAYASLVWNLARAFSRENPYDEVSPDLIVGRRLPDHESPEGIVNYVDLTSEFDEPKHARKIPGYSNFPLLDAGAPAPENLQKVIASLKPGRTFVHCAQGHGRTGLFALALLITSRSVGSVEQGIKLLQAARPGIRLNNEQQQCIQAFAQLVLRNGGAK